MIKLLVFDFDGVFTDGKIYFDNSKKCLKHYNVKDGMGINIVKKSNIKVGVISGFNENNAQISILNHIGFDYISIGDKDKLNTLKKWCKDIKVNLETEVAYMGDDINDIEILNKVALSGCPKNAVKEVLNIVTFVSDKNGGEGCVRDFCDYVINNRIKINTNIKTKIDIIDQIKNESLFQLNNFDIDALNNLSKIILNYNNTNNIYFIGVGKSLNMAQHTCNILKSINISCNILDPLNSMHGDIGCLKKGDLLLCYSKSGNTKELIDIILYIKQKGCYIIGVCCHKDSKFKKLCNSNIVLPFKNEILNNNNISSIPTNSYMAFVYFTNILTYYLILNSKLTLENYKINHPAGNIGEKLKKIKEVLIDRYPKIILKEKVALYEILLKMTQYKLGCCFFVDDNNNLLGLLTDGDIRRKILNNFEMKQISINEINTDFYYETDLNKYLKDCKKIGYIPILQNKKIIGIINL